MASAVLRRAALLGLLALGGITQPVLSAGNLPLWELTGTRNHVLLLGSIHILRAADYPLDPAIDNALRDADAVVMELDMDDLDPAAGATTIAGLARDPRGRSLPDLLGAADWESAQARTKALGLDLQPLSPFEPWYAAVILTQLRLAQLGFDQNLGVEAHLTAEAHRLSKEIRGLETLEQQLKSLDTLSPDAQREFLRTTLDEAGTIGGEVDGMIAAWKAGDSAALDRELLGSVRGQPEVYRSLIVRRNADFARQVRALANRRENYLVIVGALHLVGPDSVLVLLERQGLASRQLASH